MDIAHIIPPSQLSVIPLPQKIHLCLAHLVEKYPKYAEYYKHKADRGATVILDNSAFELGTSYSAERMFELADEVNATEIMAPEFFKDSSKTIDAVYGFIEKARELNCTRKIFATVCGNSFEDWLGCYETLIKRREIRVIGITFRVNEFSDVLPVAFLTKTQSNMYSRILLTFFLSTRASSRVEHHLLGLWDPLELVFQKQHTWIRSCDTSSAYAHGKNSVMISGKDGLPCEKISMDFNFDGIISDRELGFIKNNLKIITNMGRR